MINVNKDNIFVNRKFGSLRDSEKLFFGTLNLVFDKNSANEICFGAGSFGLNASDMNTKIRSMPQCILLCFEEVSGFEVEIDSDIFSSEQIQYL